MIAETSKTSKDQQSESATVPVKTTRARARARVAKSAASENNTCRICNLISAEKATFQREKCPAML